MKKLILTAFLASTLSAAYAALPDLRPRATGIAAGQADTTSLADYVGKFKMEGMPPEYEYMEFKLNDGKLIINTNGVDGPMTPMNEPDTFDSDGKATFLFTRDENKKVISLTLNAQGMTFTGTKEQ